MADKQDKKGDSTKKVVSKHVETEERTQLLKVILGNEEVSNLGRQLAEQHKKRELIAAEKKEVLGTFTGQISTCDTQIQRLSDAVNQGSEMRHVMCKVTKDYDKGMVTITRTDTKKLVEKRKLSDEEQQMHLKMKGENNKAEIAKDKELVTLAIEHIKETKRATTSSIQRKLKIGYAQAARILDKLEADGIVGPPNGAEPRQILIDLEEKPEGDGKVEHGKPEEDKK